MAAIIPLRQTSKWAKQQNLPPTRKRNQVSRTREYLTPDEVERVIVVARQAGGRLAERDCPADHGGLPARAPRVRADRAAMGPNRSKGGHPACRQTQARLALHPSAAGPGASSFTRVEAPAVRRRALRIHVVTWRPDDEAHRPLRRRRSREGRGHRVSGSSTHAASRHGLLPGERR